MATEPNVGDGEDPRRLSDSLSLLLPAHPSRPLLGSYPRTQDFPLSAPIPLLGGEFEIDPLVRQYNALVSLLRLSEEQRSRMLEEKILMAQQRCALSSQVRDADARVLEAKMRSLQQLRDADAHRAAVVEENVRSSG
jgi:hypothetical protein